MHVFNMAYIILFFDTTNILDLSSVVYNTDIRKLFVN